MPERLLPASPNWYCSRSSDANAKGVFGFGAKNSVYLISITSSSPVVVGELIGHRERVSGFTFCHYLGQEDLCASSSDDGTVKIWDCERKIMLKEHRAHQSTITALHWSPLEKDLVVSGDEKGVVVCYWHNRNDTQSFFPEPRNVFCLSCSPHNENYIAVGYKDGMIIVIDISKKNEVVHRLRGHDDEVHALAWCPEPGEEALHSRPEEGTEMETHQTRQHFSSLQLSNFEVNNGLLGGCERGCYLASGSKDQTVRVWSTAKGKGVMTLKLPFLKRRGAGVDPGVKERLWLTVNWPKGHPTHIVSSCFGGELLSWDLMKNGKQKWTLLGSASEGQTHSRIVFNMTSVCVEDNRELLISISMDREIKCWDLSTLECCWTLPSLGGFVYALTFSPVDTGSLAVGVGDNMIRVWSTLSIQNKHDTKTFWQGIKSKVTALSWHTLKEGSLAFGTDDGKVGIYEAYSNKPPQISSTYHRKTVYTVAWGPPIPPLTFGGDGDKLSVALYSCAGEGVIFQHNPWKLAGEASDIDKVIRDTNGIKHKLSPHTDLSWKPDGKILAIGNEDGSVDVFQAPNLKLLCTIQQHHKIINVICWHHEHGSQSDLGYLIASGSSNAIVYVHNLKTVIESPPESPALITEPYRSLVGHTAKITSLAWSPHHDGRLVSVCYDGTAQVWDVPQEEAVCNYRGHKGRLLCVQWSPVDPDVVWTGGDDFTVQEWAVSKQEHTKPPKGKKGIDLEKKRSSQQKVKAKKKKKQMTSKAGSKPQDGEVTNGEGEGRHSVGLEEGPSDLEEEEEKEREAGPQATMSTPIAAASKESNRPVDRIVSEKIQNGGKAFAFVKREVVKEERKREKQEIPVKKRKPRSLLPLSTTMDHRPKEELQQDCLTLAAIRHSKVLPSQCVPGSGDHIQLGLFGDRKALYQMFEEEGKSHIEGGHYDSAIYLLLWKGDITGALQMATEKGELTDHLVSIAPMAGYQVWSRTVEAFVKQLCFQEQFVKAASYLLSIHKVYEAVELLRSRQLYREAIALSKARLCPEDPVLKDLYTAWAAILEKDGHYSTAAKCYLAADSAFDAAKVIAKKGDVVSLRAAAELALIVGEKDLSHSLSLRCAKELLSVQDWLAAQEVLQTQESLLGHQLLFCTNELLWKSLADTALITWSSTSAHSWMAIADDGFLTAVSEVWVKEFGISPIDSEKLKLLHQQLKSMENPPATVNVPIKQLLFHLSVDLTLTLLSALAGSWGEMLEEMLCALSRCRDTGHFILMKEICGLLFPKGTESISNFKGKLDLTDEKSISAAQSLEAFICYLKLYELWWTSSSEHTPLLPEETIAASTAASHNDEPNGPDHIGGAGAEDEAPDDECSAKEIPDVLASAAEQEKPERLEKAQCVLTCKACLSEPHAMLQACERAKAEVQHRLSNMVYHHLKNQGDQHKDHPAATQTENDTPASEPALSEEHASLPSLIALVSEHNKQLAEIPEHVKEHPFPDVMECCLILLHMARTSEIPVDLQKEALALVQKYGTTHALRKACQKFLTPDCTGEVQCTED
ncbi:gem-associated protein 5 isoform X1 [Amia ocellicauda]|uniref:gem-associated protein 5 isoform X1 n=1 Tax=Amia ocellicauda TaxID=2972642 RepID=UPI003463CF00